MPRWVVPEPPAEFRLLVERELAEARGRALEVLGKTPHISSRWNGPRRYWTRTRVVLALHDWTHSHGGEPPTVEDWRHACPRGRHPSSSVMHKIFGGWNMGLRAAGLSVRPPGRTSGSRLGRLTDEEVAQIRADTRRPLRVAVEYGISPSYVSNIRSGRRKTLAPAS